MKRGRDSLLPDEKYKRSFRNLCLALAKGDQNTAKKELDVIEGLDGRGELWNGFLWGLTGIYDSAIRKDERATFVLAYSRLSAEDIKKLIISLKDQEKVLFLSERERGVFEANIYALEAVKDAIEKGSIKREVPIEDPQKERE